MKKAIDRTKAALPAGAWMVNKFNAVPILRAASCQINRLNVLIVYT
jgi:hypothetical protein